MNVARGIWGKLSLDGFVRQLNRGNNHASTYNESPSNVVFAVVDSSLLWQDSGVFVQANQIITLEVVNGVWIDWVEVAPYNRGIGSDYICTDYFPYDECIEPMPDDMNLLT
jgi:hypothetical protein